MCITGLFVCQLVQAAEGKFNPHIHVEYEWSLRLEEMDESDDDLDDKVSAFFSLSLLTEFYTFLP